MAKLHPFATQGTLAEANITSSQTSLTETSFTQLPVVNTPDTLELVIDPYNIYGHQERVSVTSHAASSNVVTVVRAAYATIVNGTTPSGHNTTNGVTEQWFCAVSDQDLIHANLANLTSDDHQEYLLVNGTRPMSGALTVTSLAGTSGNVDVNGGLLVSGAANIAGGLTVQENVAIDTTLTVAGLITPESGITLPKGRIYRASGTVGTADGALNMNNANFLTLMTNTSSGLAVTIEGNYWVTGQVQILVANGTTVWVLASIMKNGVVVSYGNRSELNGPFDAAATHTDLVPCDVGDILQLGGRASVTSTCDCIGAGQTNFLSAVLACR